MLRRAPTALATTALDIADFESYYARRVAHEHFLRTGEDPHGWFQHAQARHADFVVRQIQFEQQRRQIDGMSSGGMGNHLGPAGAVGEVDEAGGGAGGAGGGGRGGRGGKFDPSDELKPLPGDKARIVRGREERIVGTGTGAGAGGTV